ncbi:tRNA (N(6)-L-threonylcarbamoyladenosine(37)-C(2))-methylthiotransferase MtaB [Thermobrachium celere]|uniref:Threonylcarbamoyladenosine tRNA methylthiotransferase MtaB n=1 Tax=Thermobrachium celere DSM 8682 TaxID=941824 RepID=R7RPH5_9CLOT|nr:tRNA (N(6)-L-threonylcarbamoyladenosine(37)-C(2))-methylthiotransferase MtaB [Thermobrachium celere]CDF58072.1 MiaB family protein, possibly involved in tRNA or rRNA modification [Thermobrachium celere DSM 8682]
MKKVAFYTLGCRVNQYETEAMAELFEKDGYQIVDFEEYADIYVINTCTVTSIGDKKSRQMLRRAKKINKNAIVVAVGCYAQVAPDEVASIDDVDIIIGTDNKSKILEYIDEYKQTKNKLNKVKNIMSVRDFEEMEIDHYQDKTRAFLKIQDGCDRFCSYCLIPYARGPVRSKKFETIIEEVKKLVNNGYKEIILSGIHVASYGKDLGNVTLVDVIEELNKIEGLERIRIGSVEPSFFTLENIIRLSNCAKLCEHFHLSLQSGCDETLKRMNRHYTTDEYYEAVQNLRIYFKDVSITTDIIVGFPGETEDEFNRTYEFLKKVKLTKLHVFKYSPRKGTKAASLKETVSNHEKEVRSKKLIELSDRYEKEFYERFIDRTMDILVEEKKDNLYIGYTRNYLKVGVESINNIEGEIVNVKIKQYKDDMLIGSMV